MTEMKNHHPLQVSKSSSECFWGLILLFAMAFSACKNQESLYEEYIIPGGRTYPAKAMNAKANPGNKRIEIAWQNGFDPKVTKARIFWNNDTDSVEVAINPNDKQISKTFALSENTYSFFIRTYHADGRVSIPAEVNGKVYGDMYESSLKNRSLKSAVYDNGSLVLDWSAAEETVSGITLFCTDPHGTNIPMPQVEKSEMTTKITNFEIGSAVWYQTIFKPDTAAIDDFHASKEKVAYLVDITSRIMTNYLAPFQTDAANPPAWNGGGNRYANALGWKSNTEGSKHGMIDTQTTWNYPLGMLCWAGYTPNSDITNGKIYQTVELEAGTYKFTARRFTCTGVSGQSRTLNAYVTVNKGNSLEDVENIEKALAFASCSDGIENVGTSVNKPTYNLEFVLSQKSEVSLGIVGSMSGTIQLYFDKFELFKQF